MVRTKTSSPSKTPSDNQLILDAYFGRRVAQRALDAAVAKLGLDGEAVGDSGTTALDAAVAAILLASIRDELPQWASIKDGQVTLGRTSTKRARRSPFTPKHLFTLNWADSGPGFSWPMAYYATEVASHNAVVVTASADCPETMGFCDVALGHFPVSTDLLKGAGRIITRQWSKMREFEQERWAYLFDEGLVLAAQANVWADAVWNDEGDDDV